MARPSLGRRLRAADTESAGAPVSTNARSGCRVADIVNSQMASKDGAGTADVTDASRTARDVASTIASLVIECVAVARCVHQRHQASSVVVAVSDSILCVPLPVVAAISGRTWSRWRSDLPASPRLNSADLGDGTTGPLAEATVIFGASIQMHDVPECRRKRVKGQFSPECSG